MQEPLVTITLSRYNSLLETNKFEEERLKTEIFKLESKVEQLKQEKKNLIELLRSMGADMVR